MPMKILILEDHPSRQTAYRQWVAERWSMYDLIMTDDPVELLRALDEHDGNILAMSLDHDLNERKVGSPDATGMDAVHGLLKRYSVPPFPVVIATTNTSCGDDMESSLKATGAIVRRVVPFDGEEWIPTDWHRALKRAIQAATTQAQDRAVISAT